MIVACFCRVLYSLRDRSTSDAHPRGVRHRVPAGFLQRVGIAGTLVRRLSLVVQLRSPAALRLQDSLGSQHDDHAAIRHHGQQPCGLDDGGGSDLFLARVEPIDVERPQLVFDHSRNVGGQARHLGFVVSEDQIDAIGLALGELLADGGGRQRWHSAVVAVE
jgi:hypothetical protein